LSPSYEKTKLLRRAGWTIDSIVKGLEEVEDEDRRRIMEKSGEVCAINGSLPIARQIAEETTDVDEIVAKANDRIPWCGKWVRNGSIISATCHNCGCPLVQSDVVSLIGTFCYCSVGWVRTIFEALLRRPVTVELEKAIGLGDDVCKYSVRF
jgi:hypothetical protein